MNPDYGTGHCSPVSTERFEWMVWGALVMVVAVDAPGRKPVNVLEQLKGMVPDEATARGTIEVIRNAEPYDRVTSALRYLNALKEVKR